VSIRTKVREDLGDPYDDAFAKVKGLLDEVHEVFLEEDKETDPMKTAAFLTALMLGRSMSEASFHIWLAGILDWFEDRGVVTLSEM